MSDMGDLYSGTLPGAPCGSIVEYYVTVDSIGGTTQTTPADAPTTTYSALSAPGISDIDIVDFEDPSGWTVSGDAGAGVWESGIPAGDGTRGDPTEDFDGSGSCFLTENAAGNTDVDDGTTILTSPTFDISLLIDPQISYARWFSNVEGGAPEADVFIVEASDNGSVWVNVETVGPTGADVQGGWIQVTHAVPAGLIGTSTLQVRFSAADLPEPSVVEAAIDDFRIRDLDCDNICVTDPPDCSGLNSACAMGVCNPADGSCVQQMLDGIMCRPSAGDCDAAEVCDGVSTECPADVMVSMGTECRAAAGDCDAPESCDGVTAECPPDDCAGAGTLCDGGKGPGTGECDGACLCEPVMPGCEVIGDCADNDNDDIRDDGCVWWACVAGTCEATDVVFADMAGGFGACPPDGAADGNDRFAALNCFANVDPNGKGKFTCEDNPPVAFNVDAGGAFGSCDPDGVCDGNDAFAALNAFGGATSCSCPLDGPAPQTPVRVKPQVTARAELIISAEQATVRAGEVVHVTVALGHGLADVRGYQLHMNVRGGKRGMLQLVDVIVPAERVTEQFEWSASNVRTQQVLVGRDGDGIGVAPGTLATFVYKASAAVAGRFVVELLHDANDVDQRTYLFPTASGDRIALTSNTVTIEATTTDRRVNGR